MRKILWLILTALFFFSASFAVTYWGVGPERFKTGKLVVENEDNLSPEETPQVPEILKHQPQQPPPQTPLSNKDNEPLPIKSHELVVASEAIPVRERTIEERVAASMEQGEDFSWDQSKRYIGIFQDKVALFQGEPGIGGLLLEQTDIPISTLPQFEIGNLRRGIAYHSEDQKYSILEGLHFPH